MTDKKQLQSTINYSYKLVPRNNDILDHGDGYDLFEKVCLEAGVCGGIGESVFSAIDNIAPTVKEVDLNLLAEKVFKWYDKGASKKVAIAMAINGLNIKRLYAIVED